MSLNRWDFKWRLKVTMFSHTQMSAGREFQVDAEATEKERRASSVNMRGTTSSRALEERRVRGGAWVCTSSPRYVGSGCGPHLVSHNSHFIDDLLPHQKPTTLARLFRARCSLSKVTAGVPVSTITKTATKTGKEMSLA